MKSVYIYPGSFCPPTFGHLHVVQKAAEICDHLIILCSVNENKGGQLFSPEECAELWQAYNLPKGTEVTTLEKIRAKEIDFRQIVMVRGIRDDNDFEHEKKVLFDNYIGLGIDKYIYLVGDPEFREISSSEARRLAKLENSVELKKFLAPPVIEALLKKTTHSQKGGVSHD